jgi:hypothetical protein
LRRLLKFLHTIGAIGFMGALACLLVLARLTPPPTSLPQYALICGAMGDIAAWVLMPSLVLTLIPGLLALVVTPGFQNAGWALAKLATGVLIFEGGLVSVVGPIQEEAQRSASAVAGHLDPSTLTRSSGALEGVLWVLLAVSTANVVLGVWRPRFNRLFNWGG